MFRRRRALHVRERNQNQPANPGFEGGIEEVRFALPAVVAAQKGLNEPRYASLKGIMAAKKKAIAMKTPADAGVDPAAISVCVPESVAS